MNDILKKTSLYKKHIELGAKIVPFAGYEMPLQYEGVISEHLAVRNNAGIFDVSHMGEFILTGKKATDFLNYVTVNDLTNLEVGQAQYSAMCYEDGGIVDDLLIYKYSNFYMLVVNAANIEKDWQWLNKHIIDGTELQNRSDEISLIALQGPKSKELLSIIAPEISDLKYYTFSEITYKGHKISIGRTGYTGELGFEIYANNEIVPIIWDDIFNIGNKFDLKPAGLAARDTLRLELKYCLYGNDIDKTTHPFEAGLGWITKIDKDDFIGKKAILERKEKMNRRLVCIEMIDKAIPRQGYEIYINEVKVGYITSGGQSPSLEKGIGLAYINRPYTKSGTEIEINIRGKKKQAVVIKPPFYKNGTALD
jgi:aminomethyltransferase